MFLYSDIDASEPIAQNQSRPEEITLREEYSNDLLFQDGSFGENIWETKIIRRHQWYLHFVKTVVIEISIEWMFSCINVVSKIFFLFFLF